MSSGRKPTPAQARERRARIAAVALSVVFLGVCAIQAPRVLKAVHGNSAPPAAAPSAPAASASLAAAAGPAPAARSSLLRFTLKDPFRQQVAPTATGGAPAASPTPTAKPAAGPPDTGTRPAVPVVASAPAPTTVTFTSKPATRNPAARRGVLVLLDGNRQGLLRGDLFPVADPVFRLKGFTRTTARLQLVGGTLAGGGEVLTLRAGHRLVLRNATTGARYVLEFVHPALVVPRRAAAPKG